jgi:hypothetical protein
MLAGANDLIAIFSLGSPTEAGSVAFIQHRSRASPTPHNLSLFFQSLDGGSVSVRLGAFARGEDATRYIAIDGKTKYGSRRLDAKAIHALSAFASDVSVVIGDLVVAHDQNEISAALTLLKGLPLDGAVITGDAILTQKEICRHIGDRDGHYHFAVKDNQRELPA